MLKGSLVFHLVLGDKLAGTVRLVDAAHPASVVMCGLPSKRGPLFAAFDAARKEMDQAEIPAPWKAYKVDACLRQAQAVLDRITPSRHDRAKRLLFYPAQLKQYAALGRPTIQENCHAQEED